ncbi:hypothetical protein CPC08DRAFT_400502 [Agrocybe pediades]|nr:hypothetical protein CPC08DRAFT_400502 [Agrocybe pediades]
MAAAAAESHYHYPQRGPFPRPPPDARSLRSPTSPAFPSSPPPFYTQSSSSTPSLRAFSIKSTASSISKLKGLMNGVVQRGRSRTTREKEPTLKDLIARAESDEFDFECEGDKETEILYATPGASPKPRTNSTLKSPLPPPLPRMPSHANQNASTKAHNNANADQTTGTSQRPRSKSRTIIRMITTKLTPKSSSSPTGNPNESRPHRILRSPPAVANTTYSKDARDAALRARGLLPPLLPNKDLSAQEKEQDMHIPIIPLHRPSSGSEEGGSSATSAEGSSSSEGPGLSAADQIKLEWERQHKAKALEKKQKDRMTTFKFGGGGAVNFSSSESSSGGSSGSPSPNIPHADPPLNAVLVVSNPSTPSPANPSPDTRLPDLPSSASLLQTKASPNLDQDRPSSSSSAGSVQAYMFPLPPSPSTSTFSKAPSTHSTPPHTGKSSTFDVPDLPTAESSASVTPVPTPTTVVAVKPHELNVSVGGEDPSMSPKSGTLSPRPLPTPPAISLTPPSAGVDSTNIAVAVEEQDALDKLPDPAVDVGIVDSSVTSHAGTADSVPSSTNGNRTPNTVDAAAASSRSLPSPPGVLGNANSAIPPAALSEGSKPISTLQEEELQEGINAALVPSTSTTPSPIIMAQEQSQGQSKQATRAQLLQLQLQLGLIKPEEQAVQVIVTSDAEDVEEEKEKVAKSVENEGSVQRVSKELEVVAEGDEDELEGDASQRPSLTAIPEDAAANTTVTVKSPPQSPNLVPLRRPQRGLTDQSSVANSSLHPTSPTTTSTRKSLNPFKRGNTIAGPHNLSPPNDDNAENQPVRRTSIMAKMSRSVVGTITGGSHKQSTKASRHNHQPLPPPSPKLSNTTRATSPSSPPPPTSPRSALASPTSPHFAGPQRRPNAVGCAGLARQQSQPGLRQPVTGPVAYTNRASIIMQTAGIEDEESRRMTELAFLG